MAVKHFCDFCGTEVDDKCVGVYTPGAGNPRFTYDVCVQCQLKDRELHDKMNKFRNKQNEEYDAYAAKLIEQAGMKLPEEKETSNA